MGSTLFLVVFLCLIGLGSGEYDYATSLVNQALAKAKEQNAPTKGGLRCRLHVVGLAVIGEGALQPVLVPLFPRTRMQPTAMRLTVLLYHS